MDDTQFQEILFWREILEDVIEMRMNGTLEWLELTNGEWFTAKEYADHVSSSRSTASNRLRRYGATSGLIEAKPTPIKGSHTKFYRTNTALLNKLQKVFGREKGGEAKS